MEWNRKIEDKLTQNWQWLLRTVMLKEVIHVLIEDKIISLDYWMNLKEKQISEQDRNANFFFEVSKFTKERYKLFIEALNKGAFHHLADMLEIKPQDDYVKSSTLGPKNERITKKKEKIVKTADHLSKQGRSPSDIKRENSELRNQLTTITSHVGHLHDVAQSFTGNILPKDATFVADKGTDSFRQQIQNIEEHEKYLELQDVNLKQEMAIKHLRSEIVDLKLDLNHQINQLEIKLKDANVKKELKEHETENLVSKVTGIKTQLHSISKDLEHEREEKSKLKVDMARLDKVNGELHDKIKQQSSKVVSLECNILQIKQERDSAQSKMKNLEKKIEEKKTIEMTLKQEKSDLGQDLKQANSKAEELENENEKLTTKVNEFEKQILDLKVKLHKLEGEKMRGRLLKSNIVPSWR